MPHLCIGHFHSVSDHFSITFSSSISINFISHFNSLMLATGLWTIELNRFNAFETKIILQYCCWKFLHLFGVLQWESNVEVYFLHIYATNSKKSTEWLKSKLQHYWKSIAFSSPFCFVLSFDCRFDCKLRIVRVLKGTFSTFLRQNWMWINYH